VDARQFTESPFTDSAAGEYDCHVWVADREGRIYDIVTPLVKQQQAARSHGKALGTGIDDDGATIINGKSAQELADAGLHYFGTSESVSATMVDLMGRDRDYGDGPHRPGGRCRGRGLGLSSALAAAHRWRSSRAPFSEKKLRGIADGI
jgi:hypothetical protein